MTSSRPTVLQLLARASARIDEAKVEATRRLQPDDSIMINAMLQQADAAIDDAKRTASDAMCEAQSQIDRIG